MGRVAAFIWTALVGGLVALQPPANAALGKHVGDIGAAFVSLTISVTIMAVLLIVAGHPARLSGLSDFRPEYAVGGIAGAVVVLVSLVAVKPLGAGGVAAVLVTAQLLVSVIADRFSWYDLPRIGLNAGRLFGLVLVVGGTLLITRS